VERVLDAVLDLDHDGLVHLVADHVALTGLAVVAGLGVRAHGVLLVLSHHLASAFLSALSAFLSALSAFSDFAASFSDFSALASAFASALGAEGAMPMPSSRSRISV